MTMRMKVLVFAAVAIGLVVQLGVGLFDNASDMASGRNKFHAIHAQLALYSGMRHSAWSYLKALAQARAAGEDTRPLLRAQEGQIGTDSARLEALLARERQGERVPADPGEPERIARIHRARLQWAARMEQQVQALAVASPMPAEQWWLLLDSFEQEVGIHLNEAERSERLALQKLDEQWDQKVGWGRRLGTLVPALSFVLVGGLAALILVPLHRSLQQLMVGTQRLGRGDFEGELPAERGDELGTLARAFNAMASALRDMLKEKQGHHARLEESMRARTAELEQTNAQLADSLQQLKNAQAKLLFADRLAIVGQLAAGVGHEINNPLAYVISNLSYAHKELNRTQGAPSEEDRRELLTVLAEAREGAERVRVIVQDLKNLARVEDSRSGAVDVRLVVRGAVKMASHQFALRARVVEECGDVPAVRGNAARLGQVFLNLLLNAAQAIPRGHMDANEVRVVARQESPEWVLVEVSDTGEGIPEELVGRIFDPFFSTKPVGEGTGLGLSVCHSIITGLGGTISVESRVGQGTTFRIRLPVAQEVSPMR